MPLSVEDCPLCTSTLELCAFLVDSKHTLQPLSIRAASFTDFDQNRKILTRPLEAWTRAEHIRTCTKSRMHLDRADSSRPALEAKTHGEPWLVVANTLISTLTTLISISVGLFQSRATGCIVVIASRLLHALPAYQLLARLRRRRRRAQERWKSGATDSTGLEAVAAGKGKTYT